MADSRSPLGREWENLLDEACRRSLPDGGSAQTIRRSLSVLTESERDELDLHLSGLLSEEESDAMADCVMRLESQLADQPAALELLEHVRQDIARTALRCIEQSYRFGKRRGHREALDLMIPYIQDLTSA